MASNAPVQHPDVSELIPTERIAVILWRIYDGETLTTTEIAAYVGISESGVYRMMGKISRVAPVRNSRGNWQRL